jgi:hypothetical protein
MDKSDLLRCLALLEAADSLLTGSSNGVQRARLSHVIEEIRAAYRVADSQAVAQLHKATG